MTPRQTGCRLQLCRPLSGAVSAPASVAIIIPIARFNCAAPFRERLARSSISAGPPHIRLQLCRPLSGAVTSAWLPSTTRSRLGFNCAAPFRERLHSIPNDGQSQLRGFNCAAPFRERLANRAVEFAMPRPLCAFLCDFGNRFRITTSNASLKNLAGKRRAAREVPVATVHHRASRRTEASRPAL